MLAFPKALVESAESLFETENLLYKAMAKIFRVSGDFANKFRVGRSRKNFFARKKFGF